MNEPLFSVFSSSTRTKDGIRGKVHCVLGDATGTLCGRDRSIFEVIHGPNLEVTCLQCLKVIETMTQEGRLAPPL